MQLIALIFFLSSLTLCFAQISQVTVNTSNMCLSPYIAKTKIQKSTQITDGERRIEVVSGYKWGNFQYFAKLGVGTPAVPSLLVLDTGSDITWVQCKEGYPQVSPIFKPQESTTYFPLPFDSPQCQQLPNPTAEPGTGLCMYEAHYDDKSYSKGFLAADKLTLQTSVVENFPIGCGVDNKAASKFTVNSGVLGIGGGPLSLISQFQATSFSYCFIPRDAISDDGTQPISILILNFHYEPDLIEMHFVRNTKKKHCDTYYYIDVLTGISVGDTDIGVRFWDFAMDNDGNGGIIVDSGTVITRLRYLIYTRLRDRFREQAQHLPPAPRSHNYDTCYTLARGQCYDIPSVSFYFGGQRWILPGRNVLVEDLKLPGDENEIHCLAFSPKLPPDGVMVIGNHQQQGVRMTYDLQKSIIGVSPDSC